MKTLLVIAQHPELSEAVRAVVDGERYRVIQRATIEEAEPLLASGLAEACILDADLTSVQAVWLIEKVHRRVPKCPLLVYTAAKQWEWEEEAYVKGVSYVLTKPVRGKLLNELLERLWRTDSGSAPSILSLLPVPMARSLPAEMGQPLEVHQITSPPQTLSLLRN